jgi:LPS O-antigen subunit length determinant protein (WzzB/FepE family)
MTETPQLPEDDDISLLDLLQTIAENLRLLVIGPIVVGLLALAWASLMPKTYESTAIFKSEQNISGQMLSASVLEPIAAKLGYTPAMATDDAHDKLKGLIKASYNAKDKTVTVTSQGSTPQAAQSLATDLLAATFVQTQPRGSEKQNLLKHLGQLQTREKELTQTAKLLERRLEQATGNGVSEVAQGYANLMGVIDKTQSSQIEVEKKLKGLDSSEVLQNPTLPTKKVAPKRGLITIMATLAAGFALLLFVFIRQALRNASQEAESAQKLSAINAAWRKALSR